MLPQGKGHAAVKVVDPFSMKSVSICSLVWPQELPTMRAEAISRVITFINIGELRFIAPPWIYASTATVTA